MTAPLTATAPATAAAPFTTPRVTAAAPLVAVDVVETVAEGRTVTIRARKRVDPDELYLRGHFPGFVIYPGVFVIETFQQAVAAGWPEHDTGTPRLVELTSVRFLAPLLPGDELHLEARLTLPDTGGTTASVRATCHRADATLAARISARYDCPEPAHA